MRISSKLESLGKESEAGRNNILRIYFAAALGEEGDHTAYVTKSFRAIRPPSNFQAENFGDSSAEAIIAYSLSAS